MATKDQSQDRRPGYRLARRALLACCLAIMMTDAAGAEKALGAGGGNEASTARTSTSIAPVAAPAMPERPGRSALRPSPRRPRITTTTVASPKLPTVAPVVTVSPVRPHPVPVPAPRPAPPATTTTLRPPPPPANPPALADPAASIQPSQAFQQSCWTAQPDIQACNQAALNDINRARAGEGLGPLQLPGGFYGLPVRSQLVVVANAERTSRGLPAFAERSTLDQSAQQGAANGRDPAGPSGYTWDSNYAIGDPTALAADFSWMYDDGPGSNNVDCTSSDHSGCWGHRHDILSPWSGSAGGGTATYQGSTALAQLFVKD